MAGIIRTALNHVIVAALLVTATGQTVRAEASPAAAAAFNTYVRAVEARLAQQHASNGTFIAIANQNRLKLGRPIVEKLTPADAAPPAAMLHHWRGTAFAPGATAAAFEQIMRDFPAYPALYAPQVTRATASAHNGNRYTVTVRVKQKHVLTVVMDTAYDVTFSRRDPSRGWSASRSTAIAEIADYGTARERALGPKDEHGFLWRLNTYWTYEERNGGLYLQIESVSLTRSIPTGLGWAVQPFVESVPRESLEFTLQKTCEALKHQPVPRGVGP
jgi:hypothetical protein